MGCRLPGSGPSAAVMVCGSGSEVGSEEVGV